MALCKKIPCCSCCSARLLYVYHDVWNCQLWTLHCLLTKQHQSSTKVLNKARQSHVRAAMTLLWHYLFCLTQLFVWCTLWGIPLLLVWFFAVLCFMENNGVKEFVIVYVLQIQITEVFISIKAKESVFYFIVLLKSPKNKIDVIKKSL